MKAVVFYTCMQNACTMIISTCLSHFVYANPRLLTIRCWFVLSSSHTQARAKEAASTGTPVPVESSAADSGMMSLFKSVAAMDPFGAVAAFIPAEEEDEVIQYFVLIV